MSFKDIMGYKKGHINVVYHSLLYSLIHERNNVLRRNTRIINQMYITWIFKASDKMV